MTPPSGQPGAAAAAARAVNGGAPGPKKAKSDGDARRAPEPDGATPSDEWSRAAEQEALRVARPVYSTGTDDAVNDDTLLAALGEQAPYVFPHDKMEGEAHVRRAICRDLRWIWNVLAVYVNAYEVELNRYAAHCKKIDGKDFEKEHENVAYKAALSQRAARSEATVEALQKQREEQMRRKELAKEQAMNVPKWSAVEAYHMAGYAQRRFRGPDELDEAAAAMLARLMPTGQLGLWDHGVGAPAHDAADRLILGSLGSHGDSYASATLRLCPESCTAPWPTNLASTLAAAEARLPRHLTPPHLNTEHEARLRAMTGVPMPAAASAATDDPMDSDDELIDIGTPCEAAACGVRCDIDGDVITLVHDPERPVQTTDGLMRAHLGRRLHERLCVPDEPREEEAAACASGGGDDGDGADARGGDADGVGDDVVRGGGVDEGSRIGGAPVARMNVAECVAPLDVPCEAAAATTDVPMAEAMHVTPSGGLSGGEATAADASVAAAQSVRASRAELNAVERQATIDAARALARARLGKISKPKKKRDREGRDNRKKSAAALPRAPLGARPDNGGAAGGSATPQ